MLVLYVAERRADAYLVNALREAGHTVETAADLADAEAAAMLGLHQAVLVDGPGLDAQAAARLADAAGEALVVLIGEAGGEAERTQALNAGADACFIRPLAFIELETRLEALARLVQRANAGDGEAACAVELVAAERAVRVNGRSVALSAREFQLIEQLAAHPGEVIDAERLGQQVTGEASEPSPELVRTWVSRLRRKLAQAGAGGMVRAVAGHGYVFGPNR
jgi:DNA-binding response OmpR family regulator